MWLCTKNVLITAKLENRTSILIYTIIRKYIIRVNYGSAPNLNVSHSEILRCNVLSGRTTTETPGELEPAAPAYIRILEFLSLWPRIPFLLMFSRHCCKKLSAWRDQTSAGYCFLLSQPIAVTLRAICQRHCFPSPYWPSSKERRRLTAKSFLSTE
jgi:hypothetical protein